MSRICNVDGCDKPMHARKMCNNHYHLWLRTKSVVPKIDMSGLAKKYASEHSSWAGAKYRCLNKRNKAWDKYGGRGIKVCDRWLGAYGFRHFLEDMGPKPSYEKLPSGRPLYTLDRIDNNGDYCPENCRWATCEEQTSNRSVVRIINIDGESHTIAGWSKLSGISYDRIYERYANGERGRQLLRTPRKWVKHT